MDIEKLEKLQALKEKGAITKQEFEQQKAAIMKAPDTSNKSVSSGTDEEAAIKQLEVFDWCLAFSPLVTIVFNMISIYLNFITIIASAIIVWKEMDIIKKYRKGDWIKHPIWWIIGVVFVCPFVNIGWLNTRRKKYNGNAEQTKMFTLQANIGIICAIILLVLFLLGNMAA